MPVKFDCKDDSGNQIEIATPLIDELVAIVNGETPSDRRPLAVEILKYVNQRRAGVKDLPELDRAAYEMVFKLHVDSLWNRSSDNYLKTVKSNGIERLMLVTQS
jgi:hypothetical protein